MSDICARTRELTGFDAGPLSPPGARLVVAGAAGAGTSELIAACAEVAPDLPVARFVTPDFVARPDPGVGVMLIDPSSEPEAADRHLLSRLRSETGIVALVCTKIDAFWEWPRRLRDHRRLLDPRDELPIFAVSSAAAMAGASDESGLPDLVSWVQAVGAAPLDVRAERARTGACLAALDAALLDLSDLSALDTSALDTSALDTSALDDGDTGGRRSAHTGIAGLTRRRRILVATREGGRTDRLTAVRAGLTGVRASSLADAASGFRSLAVAAHRRCDGSSPRELSAHPAWLDGEITRLTGRIEEALDDRLDQVAATALLGVEGGGGRPEPSAHLPVAGMPPSDRAAPPAARRGAEDALVVLIGASTGVGLGRLVVAPMASVHTLQWVSMPLTLVVGVVMAAWVVYVRRAAARRADLRTWSADALADARGRLEQRVGSRVADTESRLTGQIVRYHDRRARQVAADVADIDEQVRVLRTESSDTDHRHRDRIDALRRLRAAAALRMQELWADEKVGDREENRDGSVCAG